MTAAKDPTYSDQSATIGESDHPQHRAGPGEGNRAPLAEKGADHAEMSVFDGKGNEEVVVTTNDEEGKMAQGTGPSAGEAMADAQDPDTRIPGHSPGQ